MAVILSDVYASKSKTELIEDIIHLNKESGIRNEEIVILKKSLLLYRSLRK
jgi:hypothetical protein